MDKNEPRKTLGNNLVSRETEVGGGGELGSRRTWRL